MSLSLLYFALPSAVLANVHAQAVAQKSLYLFNNTQTVPGTSSVLKFDLTAKTYETVASINTLPTSATDALSSSVVCGDKFYAVWTDVPIASGILQASISTGKMAFNTGAQGTVYHTLACGEKEGELLIVKTVAGTSDSVVVQASKYDFDSNTDTVIGSFPDSNFAGYDTMYKFTADGKQCFAQFPESIDLEKVKTGTLYIMDTASGSVDSYKFPKDVGLPYDIFPADSKTFSVSFVDYQTQKTKLCKGTVSNTVDKSEKSEVHVSDCNEADALWTHSLPKPVCGDGNAYAMPPNIGTGPGSAQPLSSINVQTGESSTIVDLSSVIPLNFIGTVACGF